MRSLAMGKNSSFNTAINKGAAGGTNAVAEANTNAGEASIGSRHSTTDMHSNVLVNAVIRSELAHTNEQECDTAVTHMRTFSKECLDLH